MSEHQIALAFDTSTDMLACAVGSVELDADGIARDLVLLGAADQLCRRHANEEMIVVIDAMLREAGLSGHDVNVIYAGIGPGSFTGVRIGVATAKGLSCGLEIPTYGVSTLDAVAEGAWKAGLRGLVGVVDDAMRREVYPGLYQIGDEGPQRLFASETVMKVSDAAALWAERPDRNEITLVGDALVKYRSQFEEAGFTQIAPVELWYPSGEGLLRAAGMESRPAAERTGDPALILPVYTRLSDAEENERRRLGLGEPSHLQVSGVDEALSDIHLQLRPMGVNDCAAAADLEARAYPAELGHTCWSADQFADELELPGRTWWIAHDQGEIIGFAGGALCDGDLEVLDIACDPAYRRSGVASRLLARITYDAQMLGARTSTLEVARSNDAARALYTKAGYTEIGERKNYYGPGIDALIMQATLPLTLDSAATVPEPHPSMRVWPPQKVPRSHEQLSALKAASPLILAIESSCDETAVAIIDGAGNICANVVATQIDFHARFGGVVPEIASRKHTEAIVGVYEEAMEEAGASLGLDGPLEPADLAAVAVTQGPGLVGALVVGVAFAKGLAWSVDIPLICVNHLEGHLFANLFETPDLEPPFVASLLSGGHTMLVHVRDWGDYEVLGETLDDAVGEAFDKVAKALGLGYPGGPVISRLARSGNPRAIDFPRAMLHSHDYRFSLSGLKTAVITYITAENAAGRTIDLPDLAASFEAAVFDVQVSKALSAVRACGVHDFCAGGGVLANPELREAFTSTFERRHVRVTLPPADVCTDNAAMIALVAYRAYQAGRFSLLSADADPNLPL